MKISENSSYPFLRTFTITKLKTPLSILAIVFGLFKLCKNEKFHKTVSACSYWAKVTWSDEGIFCASGIMHVTPEKVRFQKKYFSLTLSLENYDSYRVADRILPCALCREEVTARRLWSVGADSDLYQQQQPCYITHILQIRNIRTITIPSPPIVQKMYK